ncbi:dimethylsulfonioproprionate lyase family protein [Xinfangfangia sp. CPCC 101601]|uniref:Dimethylsulfonioproprionate lyase family protein n=1 Tax=Pseudogemmobacter lacusdianii TaxID=3069608 RepID=A0ABU0VSS0_9RHOB|nr:dimethylsulfonioproprionate lyase family protein [Xinfangfangia sp. CPCC 101601]MDQ2064775.1 dimethylsulfonioproprionate lyase family protein [Xinfangfangia sp. CPCC 101601]
MSGLLGLPLGARGSGRARYGRAMALYGEGKLSAAQLEAYRVAAADDRRPPWQVLQDRGLPPPEDLAPGPGALIRLLLEECDRYLASLPGPGVGEIRQLLARWGQGALHLPTPRANALVEAHLAPALAAVDGHPGLVGAIAAAAPLLDWITYDLYPPAEIGAAFAKGHAYCTLIGADAPVRAEDFDLGIFLIAPHVLYRDHAHPAPELYAPLTGPHGWRFGPDRPLVEKPAHQPVWNPAHRPHLTKVGPNPFLCLYGWSKDTALPAYVLPAADWQALEALRLRDVV